MPKKRKTHILILDEDDPQRELEFEIRFQLSLTEEERYDAMDRLIKDWQELVAQHGYSKTPPIATRT